MCEVESKTIKACERYSPDTLLRMDNVRAQTVTLTLGVGSWAMCITHHLLMENNCVKLYQNPVKDVEDTAQIRNFRRTGRYEQIYSDLRWGEDL